MEQEKVEVKTLPLTRLNNAEYLRFMRKVNTQISVTGMVNINIDAAKFADFSTNIAIMNDVIVQNRALEETATMQELDTLRDKWWVYITQGIRNAEKSPLPEEQEAAKILAREMSPYIGKQSVAMEAQTELAAAMISDITKTRNLPHVETLRLSAAVTALEEANDRFSAISVYRVSKKELEKLPNAATLRKTLDDLYGYCTQRINATQTLNPSLLTTECVMMLNGFIDETNATYNRRIKQMKAKTEELKVENQRQNPT